MPDIYELGDQFKRAIQDNERAAAKELVAAYGEVYVGIRDRLDDLMAQIKDYRAEHPGKDVPTAWLLRQERFRSLLEQTNAEIGRFAQFAAGHITTEQFAAATQAAQDAQALMRAGLPPNVSAIFNALPTDAITNMVGYLADGSPLRELLDEIPSDVTKGIRTALVQGLGLGLNARQIGRNIRRAAGIGLTRSLLIARTETLRAYRQASIQTYAENPDVVDQWEWLASRSIRTCAVCLAMDGKRFPVTKPFGSHPACRCTTVPVLKSWEELGFEGIEEEPKPETGAEWFDKQPEEKQLAILGPGKLAAYNAGEITLDDLVDYHYSRKWGPVRTEKSLKDVVKQKPTPKAPEPPKAPKAPAPKPVPADEVFPEVGKFTDLAQAERWAAREYPHITFDFSGAHIDTINPTVAQFQKLAAEFPEVAARLQYVGTYKTKNPLNGTFAGANHWAHASTDGKRIALNPAWYGDPVKFSRSLNDSVLPRAGGLAWHPPGCNAVESVMTHEFGHTVDFWITANFSGHGYSQWYRASGRGFLSDLIRTWRKKVNRTKVSVYARSNAMEQFAEAFASWYHTPANEQKPVVKRLRDGIIKLRGAKLVPSRQMTDIKSATQDQRDEADRLMTEFEKAFGVTPKDWGL